MSQSDPKSLLVYVVDDNALLGQITAQIIATGGYETRFFNDPIEAREALHQANPMPDVLVTDFDLGPLHGIDLVQVAQERSAAVKSMIVSGTVQAGILDRYSTKADRFLSKPFRADDLLACLEELTRA
jgi:DNA-binding NtrC family response regulator